MTDLKIIIDNFYGDNLDMFSEKGVLEALHKMETWDKLTDYEKVEKRKSSFNYYKNHSLSSEKRLNYEESVIKITDFIMFFLRETENSFQNLQDLKGNEASVFRIRNLLYCEKILINRNISFKSINHVLLELLEPLFEKIKGTKEFEIYGFEEFLKEYVNMIDLQSKKPYDE
jgi:hypothetical protein